MRMVSLRVAESTTTLHTFIFLYCSLYSSFCMLIHTSFLLDDFPESTGVKRIIQALNANVWSSVQMKDGEMTPVQLPSFHVSVCMYVSMVCVCLYFVRTQSRLWSDEQFGSLQAQQPPHTKLSRSPSQC